MFTEAEIDYLAGQRLGRLATVAPDGTLQNNPVSYRVHATTGTIDIWGRDMANSRKFRNVAANEQVAFVVDDIASLDPWTVRCLEIRGTAEALTDVDPPNAYFSREVIRIHPRRVISWGLGPDGKAASKRTIT
ncbi:MAG TPA: PPOX class F420-dependent oxidoreductase [Micromonosporaceae bacterium]|nr:PPOX class F420-dependent oxidoreductase [Micromonosporaceae bacterium]